MKYDEMREFKFRIIICVCLTWVWFVCCFESKAEESGNAWYFAQISDTHWGVKGGVVLTRRAVEAINKLPVDIAFVVHTGDVFADTIRKEDVVKEGLEVMRELRAPVYYIPGNHDIPPGDTRETEALFVKHFGKVSSKAEVRGVLCLFMNSELRDGDERTPARAQQDWIDRAVTRDEQRPVLVFMHRPPVADRINAKTIEDWGEEWHPRWKRLLDEHPQIKAMVAGHFHRDELHWIGGVPIYVASSVASFWDRQPSVRLYKYEGGRLSYWTIYL
jgi:3',5'-cyclic AMP phosphodiesterase CpdA